jgi:sugar (pentulose or hexulose) kinase
MERAYFIGIDIGTQGARVVMLDERGQTVGAQEEVFAAEGNFREEQSPSGWWTSCLQSLRALCREASAVADLTKVKAVAVTSTSGTIIPLDRHNEPLHGAIMYSDPRSGDEALLCKKAAAGSRTFVAFNASCGLPKMLWFLNHYPERIPEIGTFIHAADFITGQLSGRFDVTDYTNALKSGFDIERLQWPSFLTSALPLQAQWLQQVVPSGTPVGVLRPGLAAELGLPPGVTVTSGMTDGCASQVASGAVNLGDWNTTIGTTLVVKGVTTKEVKDPTGALYCHRHPDGYWMPGGASNTGADWVSRLFGGADLGALAAAAARLLPTGHLAWPLLQGGERFPFVAPGARGFAPEGVDDTTLFTAYMEGVAYIERYAYERIRLLSGERVEQVFTAGGGSSSDTWLTIRSSVLNLPVRKMKNVSGAAGAAVLAASRTHYTSLGEAAHAMVQPEKTVVPEKALAARYDGHYHEFVNTLKQKGYIPE